MQQLTKRNRICTLASEICETPETMEACKLPSGAASMSPVTTGRWRGRRSLISAALTAAGMVCLFGAGGAAPAQTAARSPRLDFLREIACSPNDDQPASAMSEATDSAEQNENLPRLLLVMNRTDPMPKRDDIDNTFAMTLKAALHNSQKYVIVVFSPDQVTIKRALLEHTLAAADLVQPIQPEMLQKLAGIVGARSVLTIHSKATREGIRADITLMEATDMTTWRTPLMEQITFDSTFGKRRLKPTELIALTVDAIAERIGAPSHLAEALHLKTLQQQTAHQKPTKAVKSDPTVADLKTALPPDTAVPAEQATPVTEANPADAAPVPEKSAAKIESDPKKGKTTKPTKQIKQSKQNSPKQNPDRSVDTAVVGQTETAGAETAELLPAKPVAGQKQGQKSVQQPGKNSRGVRNALPPTMTSETGPTLLTTPQIVPPAAPAQTDYPAVAARYRQAGDLPNAIAQLRHAIDEKPRDSALRRQLIELYQSRGMFDTALEETSRALNISPEDGDLQRLYGSTLLTKGDVNGAMKIFRQITLRDPKDTAAQIALGDAYLADSQFAEAQTAYDTAALNDAKSPTPHRRLARIYASRAAGDAVQYGKALAQIQAARALTPAADVETYQSDYFDLMRLMESRLRDMLDQLNNAFVASSNGKRTPTELIRTATDLKEQAQAADDFLEKLPAAAGQDPTHAHYQQGAALLIQSIGIFRQYLDKNDVQLADAVRNTRADALTELSTARKRLDAGITALTTAHASGKTAP